jgi:outer membrane lipopolysaccharide assembly protein LptE/RlpB
MSNIPMPPANTPITATAADLVTIAGGVLAIGITVWQFRLYRQLGDNQKAIEAKQAEIDAVPADMQGRVSGSLTAQPKLDRLIEAEQAPLKHELKLLERDRKFILNKLLFAKK